MNLQNFRDVLNSTGINVYHGVGDGEKRNFISWLEFGRSSLFADGKSCEVKYIINVTYFTKIEYDEKNIINIEKAFNDNFIAFSDCRIDYSVEIGFYSYTWRVDFTDDDIQI